MIFEIEPQDISQSCIFIIGYVVVRLAKKEGEVGTILHKPCKSLVKAKNMQKTMNQSLQKTQIFGRQ